MEHAITYVGLDVHKDTIAVAIAETGRRGAAWRGWSRPAGQS